MAVAIVVHGGAWEIPDALVDVHVKGCREAAEAGYERLVRGASALDAVEAAVRVLEDDPVFDAGLGSFLNRDGMVELDAGIMDGRTLRSASVAAVSGAANPVTLARGLLERGGDRLIVAHGALELARELGLQILDPAALETPAARELWHRLRDRDPREIFRPRPKGTVGAVAVDRSGNVVAATSTGGIPNKFPGRVGDSPIVGAGFFADADVGGASATGDGEAILVVGLSRRAVDGLAAGAAPNSAAERAVAALGEPRVDGRGGVILMDRGGRIGIAFSTSRMAYAFVDAGGRRGAGCERRDGGDDGA